MTPAVVLITIFAYFIVLFGISYIVGHRAESPGRRIGKRRNCRIRESLRHLDCRRESVINVPRDIYHAFCFFIDQL